MALKVPLKELLEAGCHFGHQKQRWHPKAAQFIYTERGGIHVIDLSKTAKGISEAYDYLKGLVSKGGSVIFLGTKRQARAAVLDAANKCGAYYLVVRWPGGLFTNWEQIKKNLDRIKKLKELTTSDEAKGTYTKREILLFGRELEKLLTVYGGIEHIDRIPDALFVVDARKEINAVKEAVIKGVKIVGIVDTNTDPSLVDYPIPANDDAVGSIALIVKYMSEAVLEGMKGRKTQEEVKEKETEMEKQVEEPKKVVRKKKKVEEKPTEVKEDSKGEK